MASGGGAAAANGGGSLLLLTKPGSINIGTKSLFPFKTPNFYSNYSPRTRRSFFSTVTGEITRNTRWNSNAETSNSQKFKFKFKDGDSEEEEEEEGSGGTGKEKKRSWWSEKPLLLDEEEEAPSLFEEFIDSLWILKLFKFYGWTLPPIIISTLIATGLKAFLIALALPVGQSVLSFAFQKLTGRSTSNPRPRRRARKRRKPFVTYPGDVGNGAPRSRVVYDDGSIKNENTEAASSFGGWDELDGMESMGRRRPRKAAPNPNLNRRKASTGGKLGKRKGESDAPLLLRLLIAVFPFLASWTKML